MPAKKGGHNSGVQCLEQLRQRCVIDDITGCWLYPWSRASNAPSLWLPALQRCVSVGTAVHFLATGRHLPAGQQFVAMCRNRNCCNPAHRKQGTMATVMKLHRPELAPSHRAAIARARRSGRHPKYSQQLRAEIINSSESCAAIGRRHGLHASLVSLIRRGKAWSDAVPVASIFHLGARGCDGR